MSMKGNDINGVFGEEDSPLEGIKVTFSVEEGMNEVWHRILPKR